MQGSRRRWLSAEGKWWWEVGQEVVDAGESIGRELPGGVVLVAGSVESVQAWGRLAAGCSAVDRAVVLASARGRLCWLLLRRVVQCAGVAPVLWKMKDRSPSSRQVLLTVAFAQQCWSGMWRMHARTSTPLDSGDMEWAAAMALVRACARVCFVLSRGGLLLLPLCFGGHDASS
jgi:hypothetical protein